MNKNTKETHYRSIIKALSYRLMGTSCTFLVAWLITSQLDDAAGIGLADLALKVAGYYLHERMWLNIHFGRTKAPEYEI